LQNAQRPLVFEPGHAAAGLELVIDPEPRVPGQGDQALGAQSHARHPTTLHRELSSLSSSFATLAMDARGTVKDEKRI